MGAPLWDGLSCGLDGDCRVARFCFQGLVVFSWFVFSAGAVSVVMGVV